MRMVVVGNGSSVLKHEYGALIDTFDEVVRFNCYVIEGYEKYVGTKTTIWFRNSGKDMPADRCKRVILQSVEFPNEWTNGAVYEQYERVPDDILKEIREHVIAPGMNLSTGVQALGYLTRIYGRLFIHGFDAFEPPSLYFERRQPNEHRHSTEERKYVEHLRRCGLLTDLTATSPQLPSKS